MEASKLSTCFIVIAILTSWHIACAQPLPIHANQKSIDSLIRILPSLPQDTNRVINLHLLARMTTMNNAIQAAKYAQEGYILAQKLDFKKGEILCMQAQVWFSMGTSDWVKGTELCYKGINLSEKYQPLEALFFYCMMALMLEQQNEITKPLEWILKSKNHPLFARASVEKVQWITLLRLSSLYAKLNQLDSAFYYAQKSYHLGMNHNMGGHPGWSLTNMGKVEGERRHFTEAIDYLQQAILLFKQNEYQYPVHDTQYEIAKVYDKMNLSDSAIHYATLAFEDAKTSDKLLLIKNTSALLATIFENINIKKAYEYLKISNETEGILMNADKIKQLEQVEYKEQQRLTDLQSAEIAYNNKIRQNTLFGISGTFVLLALLLWRNNQVKQKTNTLLQEQKEEIRQTLKDLKATQTQLIQKEKLASLGELTAGIAHEIQNPLNFVNNFSELSVDLANELDDEMNKPELDRDLISDLTKDLKSNQEKINHHGKRASSIVKGMLEHSKASTGEREWTDINQLADEYLRLAYHGLRAKNQNFNCDYELITDGHLPKIEVVPQEIGKVLLNLINNSFYAVNERKKQENFDYQPKVTVSTKALDNHLEIRVKDNGTGMTEATKAKIFQPFFTTKPTGEGTGLGLSLAYDIVTKGHGGTLEVFSTEGVGSEFIITLPLKTV
jgi:two-component system NtrC family sensor kinase